MANSKKFDSQEQYWEDYHRDQLPPAEEKEAANYQYDTGVRYWLDYYEDRIGFALKEVEMQLKHAKERKKGLEFELKLFAGIFLGIIILLPIVLALPMSGVLPLMIIGGVLVCVEILAIVFVVPFCFYKMIKGIVSKVINDKDNELGDWIVQKYHVPRLTGEIQACQIHVGRYKEQLANIASWREILEQGSFDMDETELKNRMEKVNLEPKIETALVNSFRLKKLINRITIAVAILFFALVFVLCVMGYAAYYEWWLAVWQSV